MLPLLDRTEPLAVEVGGADTVVFEGGDLLISTVPAGAADFYAERARGIRPGPCAVLDVVYHRPLRTGPEKASSYRPQPPRGPRPHQDAGTLKRA